MKAGQRGRFDARVTLNRQVCREHFLLRLSIADGFPPTQPGQFVQLGCRTPHGSINDDWLTDRDHDWSPPRPLTPTQPELCGTLALLRRPFSIAGRGDDGKSTWLEFVHRVVGAGTDWLARLKPGDPVDLIGPLGNCFEQPANKSIGWLVGGGVGLPPMFYLAEALHKASWQAVAFVGALTGDLLAVDLDPNTPPDPQGQPRLCAAPFTDFNTTTVITTDDGSVGLPGRITQGMEPLLRAQSPQERGQTVVFACGPEPMLRAVSQLTERFGVDCQVCVEQSMACGMGTCQSCVVPIDDPVNPQAHDDAGRPWRYRLACTDGPVFGSKQVLWPVG